jgi:hypothetical protein
MALTIEHLFLETSWTIVVFAPHTFEQASSGMHVAVMHIKFQAVNGILLTLFITIH